MSRTDQLPPAEVGKRYVAVFADPRPPDDIRETIDALVAGDHVAYGTSWGTLLGRRELKEYATVARAAFPTLSYRVSCWATREATVYCQWRVDERHWSHAEDERDGRSSTRTMTIRLAGNRITDTWQPCDPWLTRWVDPAVTNRPDRQPTRGMAHSP